MTEAAVVGDRKYRHSLIAKWKHAFELSWLQEDYSDQIFSSP